jgi:hypothetical protein
MRILTGGSIAIMCPVCWRGIMTAGPGWVPRSSPKKSGGFESWDSERVLWIVGSTDRHLIQLFHPGTYARTRRSPVEAGETSRVSSWPMPSGPSVAQ